MDCLNDLVNLADVKCPNDPSVLNWFTEVIVCEYLTIPPQKPDAEHITNTIVRPFVTEVQQIAVDLGDGVERSKVAVTGTIKLGVEYSACVPDQQVHFAQFEVPFQGVIGFRPCNALNRGLNGPGFDIENFYIHVCLEHDQYHQISCREVKAVLVLLIWLEPKV